MIAKSREGTVLEVLRAEYCVRSRALDAGENDRVAVDASARPLAPDRRIGR